MRSLAFLTAIGLSNAAAVDINRRQATATSSDVPDYFQTTATDFRGETPTGTPAFLAETNPAPFPSTSYIPPQPLETQVPIQGAPAGGNIYQLHGQLSHYFPNPDGFGVDEFPLPPGANISSLYMLSRHGSRYPTSTPSVVGKILNATSFTASGDLAFLNNWTYKLGEAILVPIGKQELFDSGTLHQYLYGQLYPNDGSKIIARTTSQDRMLQSAEYFLAGFFGLQWPNNATLEVIIESDGYNNSLAGYDNCPGSNLPPSEGGTNATTQWASIYLADATQRINSQVQGLNFTVSDVYNMQSLCAYETVALGYSAFCDLFTYEEWQGYEYSVDINFAGNNAFQSPTGRAVGIGWAQELLARMSHHFVNSPAGTQVNTTLDSMPSTFPTDQVLNFDFSHDTNIMSDLTALGLTQFADVLPATKMVPHDLIVSHLTPFGARLDVEVISTPQPIQPENCLDYAEGGPTMYVHFILNQRTIPLGASYQQCGHLQNGWCEMSAFLNATSNIVAKSQFEYACFTNYSSVPYGTLTNGVPQPSGS
ncbi:MAG: hypothetical protein Q9162_002028 [Coniocarpon cinnabarinum]